MQHPSKLEGDELAMLALINQLAGTASSKPLLQELPPPTRHPLAYPDIWFMLASLTCSLATTSSLVPMYIFEQLTYTGFACTLAAIVANLTRERVPLRQKLMAGARKAGPAWAEIQKKFGVTPLVRTPSTPSAPKVVN